MRAVLFFIFYNEMCLIFLNIYIQVNVSKVCNKSIDILGQIFFLVLTIIDYPQRIVSFQLIIDPQFFVNNSQYDRIIRLGVHLFYITKDLNGSWSFNGTRNKIKTNLN